jgi:hypothetical protein
MVEPFKREIEQLNKKNTNTKFEFKYLENKCNNINVQLAKGCQGVTNKKTNQQAKTNTIKHYSLLFIWI